MRNYIRKTKDVWIIMGRSAYGREQIDEFDTYREARDMVKEYRLSFGAGWSLWVKCKRAKIAKQEKCSPT